MARLFDITIDSWHHKLHENHSFADDDVFREVKAYAESRDVALGKAVRNWFAGAERTVTDPTRQRLSRRRASPGSPPVSTEDVERLQDELR